MDTIIKRASEMSQNFILNDSEYRLGFVEAEQSNTKTKRLGEIFREDTKKGIELLLSVDLDLLPLYKATIFSESFCIFCDDIEKSMRSGGRIVLSGCGSTGRLSLRVEASFREAVEKLSGICPEIKNYKDSVITVMTGGDYAIICAVESFEDYTSLGMLQIDELGIKENDILVGITATAETTSIIGTAIGALDRGAKCYMVVCTDPQSLKGKLSRVDKVYSHENTRSIYMPVGAMAVTGSTRMQSSTIEQTVILSALEIVTERIISGNSSNDESVKKRLEASFEEMLRALSLPENIADMAEQIEAERAIYEKGGLVTYFADEFLLDILADTTERGPTFNLPNFRPEGDKSSPISWAFVKNPNASTALAWERCLLHTPRCIDKTDDEYRALGILEEDIKRIPKIDLDAVYRFKIGNEPNAERENGESLATVFGNDVGNISGALANYKYMTRVGFAFHDTGVLASRLNIFEHLSAKLMMNIISTGTMAKMGRVYGNYMVYLKISNKKLIDRATRIVSDIGNTDYDTANRLIFTSKILIEEGKTDKPAVLCALELLEKERKNDNEA